MSGFVFRSTGMLMKFLEKILDSNLKTIGIENIPDTPILFVANHFTRCETFILPYMLYHSTQKKVRSLADDTVFVGTLGKYLRKVGTIPISEPNRNNIMIGDLLTGRRDWLIYPEGAMLKTKLIDKKAHYIINTGKSMHRIHTGSAILALKTELLKKEFFAAQNNKEQQKILDLCSELFISSEANVNPKPLHIVPITINYYPIRPGKNKLFNLAQKFINNTAERIFEEIEIETNLLTNSEMVVHFGEAINVYEYIKTKRQLVHKVPLISSKTKNNLLLSYFRHRLTNKFMEEIYSNIYLNFDHIFAASLFYCRTEQIDRRTLKNLIYITARDIKKLKKYHLHESIDEKTSRLFMSEDNIYYDSALDLAVNQGIIVKNHNIYNINHDKLNAPSSFHKDRIQNTFRIFINELKQFRDVINIIKRNAKLSSDELADKTFEILLRSDEKEYFEDYQKYFSETESKPRTYGTPFFLNVQNNQEEIISANPRIGIIISHGYKSSPEEIRKLSTYLHSVGLSVYAVRLKGHGTAPQNIKDVTWEDWYDSFFRGYAALKQKCTHIVAAGFSTGGLLALLMAAKKKHKISAVISINAALKLNDIRVNLVPTVHYWNEFLTLLNTEKGKKEFIIDEPENPKINYSKNYLKGIKELSELMDVCNKDLKQIEAPTLVIQAKKDPVVNPKSGEIIYNKISSKSKKLLSPDLDHHVIVREDRNNLFSQIAEFIYNNVK